MDEPRGRSGDAPSGAPGGSNAAWIGGGVLAAFAVVAVLVGVFGLPTGGGDDEGVGVVDTTVPAPPTTLAVPGEEIVPTDVVAYLTADGRVMAGEGVEPPVEVASGAALGPTGLGALAVAPTGDLIAYVRNDGALVTVPTRGGESVVVATDAVTTDIGAHTAVAWDPTGGQIAYLAIGTLDMAAPRPETPPPLSAYQGVFRAPLPEGALGNVVKVVTRDAGVVTRLGDPSVRSIIGIASSQTDDFMLLESVNPETGKPYTLSVASSATSDVSGTVFSADDPAFSPDGNFIVAVGPDKPGQELIRIATDSLGRTTLASADEICSPSVSPDSTRIVYGSGPDCSRLTLISARGGTPVDITPPAQPGSATYRYGTLSWTAEGHFVVFADCRSSAGPVQCGGPVNFLNPDQRVLVPGIAATTVATVGRPLLGDLTLSAVMAGPIEFEGTFPVNAEAETQLTELSPDSSSVQAELTNGEQVLELDLMVAQGNSFTTGRISVLDPASGIDRTLLVVGTASAIGLRVVSFSGIWMSTEDMPFASGEFRLAITRG